MNYSLKAVCARDTMQCRSPRWSGKLSRSVHAVITAVLKEHNRFGASARLARVMLELLASATSSSSPCSELCSVALVLDCGLTNFDFSNSKTLRTDARSVHGPTLLKIRHNMRFDLLLLVPMALAT